MKMMVKYVDRIGEGEEEEDDDEKRREKFFAGSGFEISFEGSSMKEERVEQR